MKLIYVAGPIRAVNGFEREKNIRRAEEIALEISIMGAAVICPHSMARFYELALPDEAWLARDFEFLKHCDAMIVVPNWEHSAGTAGEIDFCRDNDIPIFYWASLIDQAEFKAFLADKPYEFVVE